MIDKQIKIDWVINMINDLQIFTVCCEAPVIHTS